jgi:hypothetical protein
MRVKSIKQVICKKGKANCKAILSLEHSHDNDAGLPVYVYKCRECGLIEQGAALNKDKPKPKRPLWPIPERDS